MLSFVLVLGDRPKVFDFLAKMGVPYAGFLHRRKLLRGAVGCIYYQRHGSDHLLAKHCRKCGISKLIQIAPFQSLDFMDRRVFREEGVRLKTCRVRYERHREDSVERMMRAAYNMFREWLPGGDGTRLEFAPKADGMVAASAILSYLETGSFPEDVLVAPCLHSGSTMNAGSAPTIG